jgi:hypothetical protein
MRLKRLPPVGSRNAYFNRRQSACQQYRILPVSGQSVAFLLATRSASLYNNEYAPSSHLYQQLCRLSGRLEGELEIMRNHLIAALIGAVIASCLFAAALWARPLEVRAQESPQWEYRRVTVQVIHQPYWVMNEANRLGKEGWEAISVDNGQMYLKRRIR